MLVGLETGAHPEHQAEMGSHGGWKVEAPAEMGVVELLSSWLMLFVADPETMKTAIPNTYFKH